MKTKSIVLALFMICLFLSSCGAKDKSCPDYLLEGARDSGFVAAYRAYFAIENGSVNEISKAKYENYIYKDDHYKTVPQFYASFEVNAKTTDPSEWEYEQSKYDNESYDTEILKKQLADMDVHYEGDVYIQITEFDEYCLVEVVNCDDASTILDSKYAVFHYGEKLSMPDGMDLSSIRNIHKYKE